MDANSWAARASLAAKRYHSALQSRSEMLRGYEENDMGDDASEEYPCPYCLEYFDIVGLCCHLNGEHHIEANNTVCPVCAMTVAIDMVTHITLQHRNVFKMQQKRKSRKAGIHSTLSLPRRELKEGNLQAHLRGSSRISSSSSAAPDPLLSSFMSAMAEDYENTPHSTDELVRRSLGESSSERKFQQSPMSIEEKEKKTKRCNFVQELLLSSILKNFP